MKHPKEERTYVMIKPDGVRKGLTGEIIRRFEQRDLKIVALEMFQPNHKQLDDHYPKNEEWITRLGHKTLTTYEKYGYDTMADFGTTDPSVIGPEIRKWLVDYMKSAPLVKIVLQGVHAVDVVRKIAGDTMPYKADMGTIRGDFSIDSPALANKEKRAVMNIIHCSETPEEAEHEIKHWFGDNKTYDYKRFGVDE
ncbi:nucleoside-diphosphate kinase [Candidatus Nomurabacteria bacterium RIFCSPHIGHO2_02_FULL_37_13]|uniref:nucleoside-diphosphate kinase n=1 Tax=Candidatus Nomurabacteria bacterium RIFCSPHIGHO2_02_FULL_37_13 TaxID=1801750 RepID=A0A1F6W4A4_9BACT|nr:MAG: nucleoside-diphosphate kinase [Candidatus Nomurabacteria bacterium RIFCSPHIGHO2_01_FULL_36_23]OGI76674.1 MAG: nucleoside-diphosphate kinase [Candidatus Nomurabacteria bacterium RIFCSPHIGHO2_02_FULL_37_13]OGI87647.1 MAG: nucleoside-diphosphate kinase [Candidatus Nomurabacteria bacterium RIFCSPLOWO2_01_FULL_37_25]